MKDFLEGKKVLVTGAAGFIGSNFAAMLHERGVDFKVLDALTYAGNPANLEGVIEPDRLIVGSIGDYDLVTSILREYKPDYIVNFAAESHVDRSVDDPAPFVDTNIAGTQRLLEAARRYGHLTAFVQISTDEVYGDLDADYEVPAEADMETEKLLGRKAFLYGPETFNESTPLKPSSPYSASKASSDMMAQAYAHSFGLPVIITRCSNNYGPYQFPEKLIPLMINNMLQHKELPVYGRGLNVRDWIHVSDHCRGILAAMEKGVPGQVYNFGGYAEARNIDIVRMLIEHVRSITGDEAVNEELIRYVGDRPGHDRRYAIDARKAMKELGWKPLTEFSTGLRDTVKWYIENRKWTDEITSGAYLDYYNKMYANR